MNKLDFVTGFYNLEGDLVRERKINLYKLLKAESKPLNEEDLITLHPRNYLERLLQIDIFIYFKVSTKLLEVTREGNEVFIRKILKHPHLLKQAIGDISVDNFVNEFLPCTSYLVRMKILKKVFLLFNESERDIMFSYVQKRYGFNVAKTFLHTCSSQKIEEILLHYEILLEPGQLKFIFDRYPDIVVTYLNNYKKQTGKVYNNRNLSKYIAVKNPKIWLKLQKENTIIIVCLGRRLSKRYLNNANSDLRNNIRFYWNFLKHALIIRKLHGILDEVYLDHFPKQIDKLASYNFCNRLIYYYPKMKRWDLFAQTYMKVFGTNVLDNLSNLEDGIIYFFPNKTIMNNWAEVRYEVAKDESVLRYCSSKKAIPLIKDKINVTSDICGRAWLLWLLVDNCAQNEDLISLETVLQYICIRHRNEDAICEILNQLQNSFKLEELSQNHWNYIKEIEAFLKLKNKVSNDESCTLNLKYIEHLILHGKSFEKEIISFIKKMSTKDCHIYIENVTIKKQIMMEMFNKYPEVKHANEETCKEWQRQFIIMVLDFNEKNSEHNIYLSNIPYLFTYLKWICFEHWNKLNSEEKHILKEVISCNLKFSQKSIIILEKARILQIFHESIIVTQQDKSQSEVDALQIFLSKNFPFAFAVKILVMKRNRSEFENVVLQFFLDNLLENDELRQSIVPWFFANEPRILLPYYDQLLTIDYNWIDIKKAKLFSHLGIDQKIIDFSIKQLQCLDTRLKRLEKMNSVYEDREVLFQNIKDQINVCYYGGIIKVLSALLPTAKYLDSVAQRFVPVRGKKELREFYMLQQKVAESLKKVEEPKAVLPILMKFCVNGYLKNALPSLYTICYRTPEKHLYSYMDLLSEMSISVRKRVLFLSCQFLSYAYVVNLLSKSRDPSSCFQKYVFSITLTYMRNNPCDELFNLVITNLNVISANDNETIDSLIGIDLPQKYIIVYKEKCWYFFENLKEENVNVENYLESLLKYYINSEDVLVSLSTNFCRHIITQYFQIKHESFSSNINNFVCSLLRLRKSDQADNFKIIFDFISSQKFDNKIEFIKCFFNDFYSNAIKDIKKNYKIDTDNNYHIELFKKHWYLLFTPIEMFDQHVLLNLLYLQSKSCGLIENYAKEVVLYLEALVIEYKLYIYNKFRDLLLQSISFTTKETYIFFYNILKFKNSTVNCLLIIDLLEDFYCYDSEETDIRSKIIEILKNTEDPVIDIYNKLTVEAEDPFSFFNLFS